MTPHERWQAVGIVALMMLAGFLESFVVALVVPIVYVIIEPDRLSETTIGMKITALTGSSLANLFPWLACGLIVLLITSALVTMLATYCGERHSAACRDRLAGELLRRLTAAPYVWLITQSAPVLARHVQEDVRAWRKEFIYALLSMVQAAIMILSPASVAIAIAPSMGFAALAVVAIVCAVVVAIFRRRIRQVSQGVKVATDAMMRSLMQILSGVREIKVSGHARYFADIFSKHHNTVTRLGVTSRMAGGAPANAIKLLGQVGFVVTAMLLWWHGGSGTEVVAQLALIGVVVSRVVPAANSFASQISTLYRSAPFVESLIGFLKTLEKITRRGERANGHVHALPTAWSRLSLQNVSFRYPGADRASLDCVDLSLERGRFYGFVGPSGAGKTTLVNLLLGLIEPTKGQVVVDSVLLADIALPEWHKRFGYVPQDAFIFDGSLRENVAFGERVDDVRIVTALERAQLGSVVSGLEAGLDTQLGERGRRFSGGQAQRVAIARALYKGCDVMLLDEATSALDSITEAKIYESIEPLRGEVLALMIAHRVSSLRNCDRIFVLDAGRIVDQGSYGELYERSEIFRSLAALDAQSASFPDRTTEKVS